MKPFVSFKTLVPSNSKIMAIAKNMYAYVKFIFISLSYSIYIKYEDKIICFEHKYIVNNSVENTIKLSFTGIFALLLYRNLYIVWYYSSYAIDS